MFKEIFYSLSIVNKVLILYDNQFQKLIILSKFWRVYAMDELYL